MRSLDALDLVILTRLKSDAKITISELARRLDSANSPIHDRIRRLEEKNLSLTQRFNED